MQEIICYTFFKRERKIHMNDTIYLYGMVMSTESFVLQGDFPQADGYGEISEKRAGIGGKQAPPPLCWLLSAARSG